MSFNASWSYHGESQQLDTLFRWASETARFLSVPLAIVANMCSSRKVHRTARIALRTTHAQRRRCYGLLRSAGDVWAWVIDCNRQLREWHCPTGGELLRPVPGAHGHELRGVVAALCRGRAEALL